MTAGHLDIRPFGPADDVEAELDLRRRAFGPIAAGDRPRWIAGVQASVDAGQIFGVFDGSRLVASARYFAMRQWWLGRSIPMAGVAGVKVAPEERGRGVGRALMLEMLAGLEDRGFLLSTLYPATARLYRALGWEIAGGKYETVLPTADLAALLPPDPLAGRRRCGRPAVGARTAPGHRARRRRRGGGARGCAPDAARQRPGHRDSRPRVGLARRSMITLPTWPTMASSATAGPPIDRRRAAMSCRSTSSRRHRPVRRALSGRS